MDSPPTRCVWVPADDPLYVAYHDHEWGVPVRDDRGLFEALTLEGAQAGLSWRTILAKREGYRAAFAGFAPERVAAFTPADVDLLMVDPAIVRHRGKIESTVTNARAVLAVAALEGSFGAYLWNLVDGQPVNHRRTRIEEIPAQTDRSRRLSRDLKQRGFRFVGPTTVYSFLQAPGLVNDHTVDCFRHAEVGARAHGG